MVIQDAQSVGVIDATTDTYVATITGGMLFPNGIAVTPDGGKAYVANTPTNGGVSFGNGHLSVINLVDNNVIKPIPLGEVPVVPVGVTITPDGATVYVANRDSNIVSVIDTGVDAVVETVDMTTAEVPNPHILFLTIKSSSEIAPLEAVIDDLESIIAANSDAPQLADKLEEAVRKLEDALVALAEFSVSTVCEGKRRVFIHIT